MRCPKCGTEIEERTTLVATLLPNIILVGVVLTFIINLLPDSIRQRGLQATIILLLLYFIYCTLWVFKVLPGWFVILKGGEK